MVKDDDIKTLVQYSFRDGSDIRGFGIQDDEGPVRKIVGIISVDTQCFDESLLIEKIILG